MASRKPAYKPKPRLHVESPPLDTDKLSGPFYVKGKLGDKLPRIHEPVWYEPSRGVFVFEDGRYAFDAAPSKHPKPKASPKSIDRKDLKEKRALLYHTFNDLHRALAPLTGPPPSAERAAEIHREIRAVEREQSKIATKLEKVATSSDKVSLPLMVLRHQPKVRPQEFAVLAEYEKKDGQVRLFLDEVKDKVTGKDKVAKAHVKAVLAEFTDANALNRGEQGYYAVSTWDYPKAIEALAQVPGVRLFGAPELDIGREFKGLDARAKAVPTRSIEFGTMTPYVGKTPEGKPAPFQEEAIKFLMSRDRAILADDMGLGKTAVSTVAAQNAVPKSEQILVVCPAATIGNWKLDIERFMPSAPVVVLDSAYVEKNGVPSSRPEKVRFVIVSYQGASSLVGKAAVAKYLLENQWGLMILDEAHRIKKPGTLGHKFLDKIAARKVWMLTGTPVANRVIDLYGLLKMAHHPIGKRHDEFVRDFVPQTVRAGKVEAVVDRSVLLKLGKGLTGLVLRRTKEEVLSAFLPRKVGGLADPLETVIHVELPSEFRKAMEEAREEKVPFERLRHALAVAKVPATWEVAQRVIDAGDRIVLFSTYTDVMHSFVELCDAAKVLYVTISGQVDSIGKSAAVKLFQEEPLTDKEEKWVANNLGQWFLNLVRHVSTSEWKREDLAECVARFGKDERKWPHKIQVVVAQMVAASEGVTLTKADTLLFNDLDHMPSRHEQAEDRIYRLSKSGKLPHSAVFIGYLLADDPTGIDAKIFATLHAKRREIQDIYGSIGKDAAGSDKRLRDKFMGDLKRVSHVQWRKMIRKNPSTLGM